MRRAVAIAVVGIAVAVLLLLAIDANTPQPERLQPVQRPWMVDDRAPYVFDRSAEDSP